MKTATLRKHGRLWAAINHDTLIEAVVNGLTGMKWAVDAPAITTSVDGTDVYAELVTTAPEHPKLPLVVGMVNSIARRSSIRLYYGLLTERGLVYAAEQGLGRNYQNTAKWLRQIVAKALRKAPAVAMRLAQLRKRLMETPLKPDRSLALLGQASANGLLPWGRVKHLHRALSTWQVTTAWNLLLTFTGEAAHGTGSVLNRPKRTLGFVRLLLGALGIRQVKT